MNDKAIPVGHIPSGLFIVCTVNDEGNKDGFLASWVQQVSFDPLLITIALKEGRVCHDHIVAGRPFSINIVGDDQAAYLRHFWKGYPPGEGPFEQIPHEIMENGTIKILDAKSVLECKMLSKTKPGDHELIVAEVIGGAHLNEGVKPKTYIRKSGLDY